MTPPYWFISLSFRLACPKLSQGSGDTLGVSRKDTRTEGSTMCELIDCIDHAVFVFIQGVRLRFAV